MKKIPMFLLMIAPYAFVKIFFDWGPSAALLLTYPSVLLLNMVYPYILSKLNFSGRKLLFWDMFLKLWNIPLYLWAFLFVLFGMVLAIPAIPFLFLLDYTLLLATSQYGISGILKLHRGSQFTKKAAALNILLHFMFCFDVFSAVYCYVKARKQGA